MSEETKRRIVFSMFIVVSVVVLCLGVLLAVYNYEASMASADSVMCEWKLSKHSRGRPSCVHMALQQGT
jgi:hypothetical protein